MHCYALAWIFMKKYWTFKVHFFLSSDVRFNALAWIFMKKYWTFKVHFFLCSDVRFNALSCTRMIFHEKILNFQSSLFSWVRCEIQCIVMHLLEFSWKNIELSKFNFFLGQMFNALSCTCLNFHGKKLNFQSSLFLGIRCEIQCIVMHLHDFSWKNIQI